jgi:hypothetical protein
LLVLALGLGCNEEGDGGGADRAIPADSAAGPGDAARAADLSAAVDQARSEGDLAGGADVALPCGGADLQSDPMNCGACGRACAAVFQGTPGCALGRCTIAACNFGFDDCDGDVGDGCETNIESDLANCGGCGKKCPNAVAWASYGCKAGTCTLMCAGRPASLGHCCCAEAIGPGWCDCDGDPMNGCEINAKADPANCGACGVTCAMNQKCVQGVCQ